MKQLVRAVLKSVGLELTRIRAPLEEPETAYLRGGGIPWSVGYSETKQRFIRQVIADPRLLQQFANQSRLPGNFGLGFDERCIEYPWLIAHLQSGPEVLLDAGSALNHAYILDHPVFEKKKLHVLTLAPEDNCFWKKGISYLFEDLRELPVKDAYYDTIVCISTLEHVGCDNTVYTHDDGDREQRPTDFIAGMQELSRVLKPGGRLFLTVPFGSYRHLWGFQQFDRQLLSRAIAAFGEASTVKESFYRYTAQGWNIASAEECAACEYVEWVAQLWSGTPWPAPLPCEPDLAAAARAVACIELIKPAPLQTQKVSRLLRGGVSDVSVKGIHVGYPDQQAHIKAPFISLIIPTLNRCEVLKNAIASAQQQTWHADRYEIIVVDNGSTDGTSQHVKQVAEKSEKLVRLISEPQIGLHNARHAGTRAAIGEILIFSDDDATFDPDWIRAYGEAFTKYPEMTAAGGPVRPVWEVPPPQWLLDYMDGARTFGILSLMEPHQEFRLERTGFFFGVNMAIRRDVLFEVGGFNPDTFGDIWLGDGETGLNRKLWQREMLIGYVPEALVYHHIPPHRMTVNYIRKWAWHLGGAEMYERWWNKKRSLVALAREGIIVVRRYWGQWIAGCLVRSRRDPWAIEKQFQASLGWCKLNYVWWMLTDPQVKAVLDEKDLRP